MKPLAGFWALGLGLALTLGACAQEKPAEGPPAPGPPLAAKGLRLQSSLGPDAKLALAATSATGGGAQAEVLSEVVASLSGPASAEWRLKAARATRRGDAWVLSGGVLAQSHDGWVVEAPSLRLKPTGERFVVEGPLRAHMASLSLVAQQLSLRSDGRQARFTGRVSGEWEASP